MSQHSYQHLQAITNPPLNLLKRFELEPPNATHFLTYTNRDPDLANPTERKLRSQRVHDACAVSPEPDGDTNNILVHAQKDGETMSYCVVPKAGCTFWIRIFRFLNNDTGQLKVR